MSMWCPSLSLLLGLGLKSVLSDIKMAIPVCFLAPFAWNIAYLMLRCVSRMQQKDGSCFYITSVLFLGFRCPLWFVGGYGIHVLPARECSWDPARYCHWGFLGEMVGADSQKQTWDGWVRGSAGEKVTGCFTRLCSVHWEWGQGEERSHQRSAADLGMRLGAGFRVEEWAWRPNALDSRWRSTCFWRVPMELGAGIKRCPLIIQKEG